MLEICGINLSFERPVLRGVHFSVPAGSVIGIVGASGGGKSSLLKTIAGLLDADSGSVIFNGEKVKGPSERLVPGHEEIQLVNQDFGLDVYHTVRENVLQKMLYLPKQLRDSFCSELIDLVELSAFSNQQAIYLSGGEQQRLAIARALAVEPEVLLLDEPFAHLDAHLKQKIGTYIQDLARERNMSCILVSHEGQDILEWCEEIHFMHEGVIERTADPIDFYFRPRTAYEGRFFGPINEIQVGKGKVLFRPNEYTVDPKGVCALEVVKSRFCGAYWINDTCTSSNESVVLFSQEPLPKKLNIVINKYHS